LLFQIESQFQFIEEQLSGIRTSVRSRRPQ
jgi:hypothetical protein